MKAIIRSLFVLLLALLLCLPLSAANPDAKMLSETIQKACPVQFGYVDNSHAYMSNHFAELRGIDDFHIVTCADSTNFSEIGVFHVKDAKLISQNQKLLKKYLLKIKQNFENGVVYNVEEYPKFENAKVFSAGEYLVYVVLDKACAQKAEKAVRDLLGKA